MRRAWLPLLALLLPLIVNADDTAEQSQLSELLRSEAGGFARALEPRDFMFPEDHGPHPEYRNEWWYVTGNLDADNGRRFGFELTIFRFALTPTVPESPSRWRTNQVYIAHFAVTDAGRERFLAAERFARGAAGLAGAQAAPFRVWIDDWEIAAADKGAGQEHWRLKAADGEFALDLELLARKPPVLNGPVLNGMQGLSRKSAEPGNASYYYSITRWDAGGRISVGDEQLAVTGLAWLDREWSSSALAADQQGWDWFALQFSDGSELMYYSLRRTDGNEDVYSAGTRIAADGTARHIARDDIAIVVTDTWASPAGGSYPAGWALRLPDEGLSVTVTPIMNNQELFTTVRYWEGAVDVAGERDGEAINGRGYVELTGYAE